MQAIMPTKQGFQLQTVTKPTPADHEVLVKVHATTVTRGDVVLHSLPGIMYWSPVRALLGVPPKKTTPGHEFAGIVEAVGSRVTRFSSGEAVFGTTTGLVVGANAEYVCVPESWASGAITHKPENLSFAQAAALPVGSMTALYLLKKANAQEAEKVLVYGASGSVGSYGVQLARHFGAEVTGVASTRNLELLTSLGAQHTIDYKVDDFTQGTETYDVIFDAVGKADAKASQRVLRQDGRFVSVSTITHESAEALEWLAGLAASGEIKPLIDRTYSLQQIPEAYDYVKSGRKSGNVVIQIIKEGA
ncbi:MAG: NAD(P)-dependent alcohol dehydrogenase [Anaerolineae bacterium]|nr:NAD(P)-dependent alcohol dehydrogenase [Anaerolineae bacterium]